jgi:hypothetical protein
MADEFEIRIDATQTRAAIRQLVPAIERASDKQARVHTVRAVAMMRARAPVGSAEGGHLRDAYTAVHGGRKFATVARYERYPHGGWIDWGGPRRGRGGGIAVRPYVRSGRIFYPVVAVVGRQ